MELIVIGSILAGQKAFFRLGGDLDVTERKFTRWDKGIVATGFALFLFGILFR